MTKVLGGLGHLVLAFGICLGIGAWELVLYLACARAVGDTKIHYCVYRNRRNVLRDPASKTASAFLTRNANFLRDRFYRAGWSCCLP